MLLSISDARGRRHGSLLSLAEYRRVSLSVFIRKKAPEIAIVQWFLDSKGLINLATGPLIQMDSQTFRNIGFDLVRRHLSDYLLLRLPEENAKPVFRPGDAKKVMKGGRALEIHRLKSGEVLFSPQVIQKYSLVHLRRVGKDSDITIARGSAPEVFWKAFEAA